MDNGYILFGAGKICREMIPFIGKEMIEFIVDNSKEKAESDIDGIKIYLPEDKRTEMVKSKVVIAVGETFQKEIIEQLVRMGISNYITAQELKYLITKERIENRKDKQDIYNKAINWILSNTVESQGIICNSTEPLSYPEVSGYYIPTLLRWGYRELALQYAGWLIKIQKEDGSWYDTYDRSPYVFDSGQILKGLLAIRDIMPEADTAIIKGCEWVVSNMESTGRLTTPDRSAWGEGRICTELIHLYCLEPLMEAGKLLNRMDFTEKAEKILEYYMKEHIEEIRGFYCLSHFYAYIMEALVDLGETKLAEECMRNVEKLQSDEGMVPAYRDVHWVCSTGLFQFALVWYKLGNIECGNKAFEYACNLQNESGGWYGSYVVEDNPNESNNYFPYAEISWANKYFLDALYYKNKAEFDKEADIFLESIDKEDKRYIAVKSVVSEYKNGRILDVGCGRGRYLKNLVKDCPNANYYGVDLSNAVMDYIDISGVELKQGSLLNIPYQDDYFDVVYTCEALEHAIDIKSAVREMARVLRKQGTIVIIDKDKKAYGTLQIGEWEQWFEKEEFANIMRKHCEMVKAKQLDDMFVAWEGKAF